MSYRKHRAAVSSRTLTAAIPHRVQEVFGDLSDGVIRLEDPNASIAKSKILMLSIIRAAACYGLSVDDAVLQAIQQHCKEILSVSGKTILRQFKGILTSHNPLFGLGIMWETGLLGILIPEIAALNTEKGQQDPRWHPEGTTWVHTRYVLAVLQSCYPRASFELVLAALLHDIAKPATQKRWPDGGITNYEHDIVGAEMSRVICQRLGLSDEQTDHVCELVRQHMRMHEVCKFRPGKLAVLLGHPLIHDLIALQHADAMGCGSGVASHRQFLLGRMRQMEEVEANKYVPLVNGDLLISLGFEPGILFKEIKSRGLNAELDDLFADQSGAAAWIIQNFGDKRVSIER